MMVDRFFYSLILDAPRKELIHRGGAEERKSVCFSLMSAMFKRLNLAKGRARHIPTQTDTVVRFAPEHVARFWCCLI